MLTTEEQNEILRLANNLSRVRARTATEVQRQITNPPQARARIEAAERQLLDFLGEAGRLARQAHQRTAQTALDALRKERKCYNLQAPEHLDGAIEAISESLAALA